jgi:hypothetical protein
VPRHRRWLGPALWLAAGALLASAGHLAFARREPAVDPATREAWGPFLAPGASVMVGIAAPAHYNILPYPAEGALPPGVRLLPDDATLLDWYRTHYPLKPGQKLGLHLSGPLRTGEVLGALTAARVFERAGVDYHVVLDKKLSLSMVRGRNLLFFANPEYSELADALLERAVWTVDYDPVSRARVIRPQKSDSGYKTFAPGPDWQRPATFGLLTVLPNAGVVPSGSASSAPARAVLVSCTNSQGCQAAMEFFASASRMRELAQRLRAEGHSRLPPAYQVVVRCDLHLSQAVAGAYEAHAVLPAF